MGVCGFKSGFDVFPGSNDFIFARRLGSDTAGNGLKNFCQKKKKLNKIIIISVTHF